MGFARAHPRRGRTARHVHGRGSCGRRGWLGQRAGVAYTSDTTAGGCVGALRLRTPAGTSRRMALRDALDLGGSVGGGARPCEVGAFDPRSAEAAAAWRQEYVRTQIEWSDY
jgi:hypothetical protein